MFQGTDDGGAQPLLVVSDVGTSYKPAGVKFRQLVLSIRFVLCLNRTRSPASLHTVINIISSESESEIKKQRLKRLVKEKNLEALNDFGGVQEAVSFLQSESEPPIGVVGDLAQTVHGLGFWGSFILFVKGFWSCLYNSLNSCTILVLVIAADLSFAIGSLEQGLEHGWHDGVGILLAVFLLVIVPSVSSFYQKKRQEKKLLKIKNNVEVTVKRHEILQGVSVFDVKEGEIIHLKKGDRVPADGLLIKGENLILDEAINSHIDPHRNPFLFSGSVVEYGKGEMIAVSIDHDTAFRKGLLDVIVHPSQETLFQSRINKPYEFIEKFSLVVSLMLLLVVLTRLLCEKHKHDDYYNDKPESKGKLTVGFVANAFERMSFEFGKFRVSLVATVLLTMIIGIQHGMPLAITISLSLWRERMRRSHKVKCRNLSACGTLGLVSVICIDVTAEFSFHEVEVRELFVGEEKINPGMEFHPDIHQGFEVAARVLCLDPNTSVLLRNNLLNFWEKSGLKINKESPDQRFDFIDHKFLSSEKGIGVLRNKSIGDTEANLFHDHFYGNASTLLNMCSNYYDIRGRIHDIENRKDVFQKMVREMEERGLRPIAFACKQTNDHQVFEGELKLLGLMGLKFSHEKILLALKDLENIGVRIILTSEDELSVAINMTDGLGVQYDPNKQEIEGERFREIMKIDGMEKNELMKSITVMGKATSEDKLLLVKELKAKGETVALLGGLTSGDVPTLIEADIGIVQENRSTKVSRLVSDLSCEDVTSLNHTLKYGRSYYLNIQKFYQVQLTALISGLLINLICTMVSGKSPITTFHLIWVTLIMCLLGSLMMVMELNDAEVRNRVGGSDREQSLITRVILKKIVIHVLCQALVFLMLEYLGQKIMPHMEEDVRNTMIFNTFILCQIANLLGAITMGLVTNEVAVFHVVLHILWVMISVVSVLAVQVMVIEFDGTIVNGVKLSAVQWIICFLLALALGWASYIFFHFVLH
ncbi:calcium-transporting ATPase 12, plasma membrane-type-like [Benincasa hispida]|uniref:calcium-transporting ATPase 12, plasma membrane-type-like n=1 Tax=Benincasa hispida TaxID=102211 RepID=UPI0019018657|nr:calcium-transporting ATPase 12, plasma membrane-type-like [Benincasa hispida]